MKHTQNPVDRRAFLRGSMLAAPALVVAFHFRDAIASVEKPSQTALAATFTPNAFLRLEPSGAIIFSLPRTEMGQSVYTAITMIAAEELEIEPAQIRIELPNGDAARFGELGQGTGGSTSIRDTWDPVRQAAADARAALVAAAARRWKVEAAECRAHKGVVYHDRKKKQASYASLVHAAAATPVPTNTPLKPRDKFSIIGKPMHRLDSRAKVTGQAVYGIDIVRPDMKVATLAQCPTFGGTLKAVNENAALAVKGVQKIVKLPDAVAVIADHYWAAKKGLEALEPVWNAGTNGTLASATIEQSYADRIKGRGAAAMPEKGVESTKLTSLIKTASKQFTADYEQPFLAHAPMEPGNCVLHCQADKLEIWTGTQIPDKARGFAAKAAGLPEEKVTLHSCLMGGGFGRRLEPDYIIRAIQVAKAVSFPIKLIWSREEDLQHDLYRPYYHDRIEAGLDSAGKPVGWMHKIAGSSIMARLYPEYFKGVDQDAIEGSIETPYGLAAQQVEFIQHESAVPTSWWRGVGGARSAFVVESFVDELAHFAKQDPIAYRRALISNPRTLQVLDLAAEKSGWGTPLAEGRARGVSLINLWNTHMAHVVEVEKSPEDGVRVVKVTVAVDCGQPVNPLGIEAQIEGGIVFGLSAALFGEITIADGRVEQSNFHDYRVLRLKEAPQIDVHIVDSGEAVGGLGEPPVAAIMPALANAVFALTGTRVRRLPIAKALAA